MIPAALVVHGDPGRKRFICGALSMFRPGYRVSSTADLRTASEWLATLKPDLVILDADLAPADELVRWHTSQGLDPQTTIILGESPDVISGRASLVLPQSVTLPVFMTAVRRVATVDAWPTGISNTMERATR